MPKPAFSDPQIDLLATGERQRELMEALASIGMRPILASGDLGEPSRVALLVDLKSVPAAPPPPELAKVLLRKDRPIVCLGEGEIDLSRRPDAIRLIRDQHIATLPERLAVRRRALLRENERSLRTLTARQFGSPVYANAPKGEDSLRRVLYIGPVSRGLIPMTRGLGARGVDLVSCMTVRSAHHHLSDTSFRMVLVDAQAVDEQTHGVLNLTAQHKDTSFVILGHAQNGLVLDGVVGLEGDPETAFDLLAERATSEPLSTRLQRVRLSSTSHDPLTGLYSEAFLRAHLPRQISASQQDEAPLTLLSLKLRGTSVEEGHPDELPRLASLLVANLRETDLAARLGQRGLLCVLRDTAYGGAVQLAGRLAALLAERADTRDLAERLSWRAVERRTSFTSDGLIAAALTGPFTRPLAA